MASSPWPTINAERQALAEDLGSVGEEQWSTPSLCSAWTVRHVLAHMTATAEMTPARFLPSLAGAGFSLSKLTERNVARNMQGSPADTLARFRARIGSTNAPPGPSDTWLGETIVHGEDIRRPLGIMRGYPSDALTRVADFYKRSNLVIGAKRRISGLKLEATDVDWSTGSGPPVSGPLLSLVLAMTGRRAALDDLSGDGVATLRSRM